MNKNKLLGLIGLIGAALIGGAILPALIRWSTTLIHPFVLNWIRVSFALPILYFLFKRKIVWRKLRQSKTLMLASLLALGLSINVTLFAFGIHQTTLIASQLIYVVVPIFASGLAQIFLQEKNNQKKFFGMGLALLGVLILIIFSKSPAERMSLGSFAGNLLIFLAMLGYTIYLTFSKKISQKLSLLEIIFITNLLMSIIFSPLAIWALEHATWQQLNLTSFIASSLVALAALFFTAFLQLAIKNLSVGSASLSSLLAPEFAALTGLIFYQEKFSLILIISLALSLFGIVLSIQAEKLTLLDRIKLKILKIYNLKEKL